MVKYRAYNCMTETIYLVQSQTIMYHAAIRRSIQSVSLSKFVHLHEEVVRADLLSAYGGDYASAITRYPRMAPLCVYVVGIN